MVVLKHNYIGETSDSLSMRINVHRQQIRDPNLCHLFVSKHKSKSKCSSNLKFKVIYAY